MATNYPGSIDSFVNPEANDQMNAPPHAAQHSDANDAIIAIQTRVGSTGATGTTTIEGRLKTVENNLVTTHGNLNGLGNDDHDQYALADGSRGNFEPTGTTAAHAGASNPHDQYLQKSGGTMTGDLAIFAASERERAAGTTTSLAINFAGEGMVVSTATGAITVTYTNVPSSGTARGVVLKASASAITWPANTDFPDGDPPDTGLNNWYVLIARGSRVAVFLAGAGVS